MEEWEIEKIRQLSKENKEIEQLWQEHLYYEQKIIELQRKSYLTPEEEVELKKLKVEKLKGKDKLFRILNACHRGE